jgi:hypothetical protein
MRRRWIEQFWQLKRYVYGNHYDNDNDRLDVNTHEFDARCHYLGGFRLLEFGGLSFLRERLFNSLGRLL